MAVAVFSRVGARLKSAQMDLDALRLELARRYSVHVDPRALATLAADKRIRRPDLDVLVAIAGVLAVPVDAFFAWACFFCNRYKSGRPRPRGSTRLYDPRGDTWTLHFAFSRTKGYVVIVGLTAIGRETVRALNFHGGGEELLGVGLAQRGQKKGQDAALC